MNFSLSYGFFLFSLMLVILAAQDILITWRVFQHEPNPLAFILWREFGFHATAVIIKFTIYSGIIVLFYVVDRTGAMRAEVFAFLVLLTLFNSFVVLHSILNLSNV